MSGKGHNQTNGGIGSGGLFSTNTLSLGTHTITTSVTDSGGLQGSDAIIVNVNSVGTITLEVPVALSSDDAEERETGSMSLTSSDLEVGFDVDDHTMGMRFNAVTIPQGATIVNASYIQFVVDETVNSLPTSPPPRSPEDDAPEIEPPASPEAMEVAALLGLTGGSGNVALIGDMAGHATALVDLVPGVEFIGIASGLRAWEEAEGVSRLTAGPSLPFSGASLRGVALFADGGPSMAGELARVVARAGRIAVWGAVQAWEDALRSEGLDVLASEETALVVGWDSTQEGDRKGVGGVASFAPNFGPI